MVMKKSLLSIKRKPLFNRITKKSPMPDFSSGYTTQTRFHPVSPTPTYAPSTGRQTIRKTRSQTKVVANVPVYSVHAENDTKRSIEDVRMTVSGVKVSEVGKPNFPPLGFTHVKNVVKNTTKGVFVSHCTSVMNDNGKEISAQRCDGRMENRTFEDNRKAVVEVSKKCQGKEIEVATPINSAPLLRSKCNRNEVDGAKDALQSKPLTDPLPNNKKKKLLSKGSSRKFVMPYDFIDQQRAYFKEIDEYKLEVEEVEQVSVYDE